MLANTLNTNEVKDSAGVEVEFTRLETSGRKTVFAKIGETPAYTYRLTVQHQETGSGINKVRRSNIRFDKETASTVDATKKCTCTASLVLSAPVGALTTTAEMANVIANMMSFVASTGADTTIKYDCTGNGARELLQGGL